MAQCFQMDYHCRPFFDPNLGRLFGVRPPRETNQGSCSGVRRPIHVFFVFFGRARYPDAHSALAARRAGISRLSWGKTQNQPPSFPRPFDGDELHLLSGIGDLSFGKSALRAAFYDQGCRRRSAARISFRNIFGSSLRRGGCLIAPSAGGGRPHSVAQICPWPPPSSFGLFIVIAAITSVVSMSLGSVSSGSIAIDLAVAFGVTAQIYGYFKTWPPLPRLRLRCWQAHQVF